MYLPSVRQLAAIAATFICVIVILFYDRLFQASQYYQFFSVFESPLPTPHGVINIGICIVGQTGRLETETKVKNLLQYNAQKPGRRLHVIGVLDQGATYSDGQHYDDSCYDNSTDMTALFYERLSVPNVSISLEISSPQTFHLSKSALKALDRYRRRIKHESARITRIQGHLRQFSHDAICYKRLHELEEKNDMRFDMVVRLRDNGMVLRPFDLVEIMESVQYRRTITKDCFAWGGYADKVWIIPRGHIRGALGHVVGDTLAGLRYLKAAQPQNSERLVKTVWTHHNVRVEPLSADKIPIVDGRCVNRGDQTIVPKFQDVGGKKDCAPPKKHSKNKSRK
mmetsp:Transcript_4968/g.7588  ORF Transcript_4968/g.7588 Transcript_4968/m.7588 type:complete len:339 (+) Transcript_4968:126-1142(+)